MVKLHKYADKTKHNLTLHMTVELRGPEIDWNEAIIGWIIYLQHFEQEAPGERLPPTRCFGRAWIISARATQKWKKCTSIH